jgi:hypothetical protein
MLLFHGNHAGGRTGLLLHGVESRSCLRVAILAFHTLIPIIVDVSFQLGFALIDGLLPPTSQITSTSLCQSRQGSIATDELVGQLLPTTAAATRTAHHLARAFTLSLLAQHFNHLLLALQSLAARLPSWLAVDDRGRFLLRPE